MPQSSRKAMFIVNSIERHWVAHAPTLVPPVTARNLKLDVTHLKGETVTVELDHDRWVGFVGDVHYALSSGQRAEERSLAQLISAARFTGVGSMVAYGFGVVETSIL